MINRVEGKCKICGEAFYRHKTTDKYCSYSCASEGEKKVREGKRPRIIRPKNPIRAQSKKQGRLLRLYSKARRTFLQKPENKRCRVYPHLPATEVHHMMGRRGYADSWARKHDIPLVVDERYFLAVSRPGHEWVEANPNEAIDRGYSKSRNQAIDW